MKITLDTSANAGYIYLTDEIKPGEVENTECVTSDINLDYNKKGEIIGIEILNAKEFFKTIKFVDITEGKNKEIRVM